MGENSRFRLNSGSAILYEISQSFTSLSDTKGLAIYLLDNTTFPGRGPGFIEARTPPGVKVDPQGIAFEAMVEWCKLKPKECYADVLLGVLRKINPSVAFQFEKKLDGSQPVTDQPMSDWGARQRRPFGRHEDTGKDASSSYHQGHKGHSGFNIFTIMVLLVIVAVGTAVIVFKFKSPAEEQHYQPSTPDAADMHPSSAGPPDFPSLDPAINWWQKVITPLLPVLVNQLDPIRIAEECAAEGLISQHDVKKIRTKHSSMHDQNADLLEMLSGTREEGYRRFKGILAKWPNPHRYAHLLNDIKKKENVVLNRMA